MSLPFPAAGDLKVQSAVKNPALGRRGALASVATTGGLSPQRSLIQRDICEMLHYVQHDTIAVKKAIWVNIYIIAKK